MSSGMRGSGCLPGFWCKVKGRSSTSPRQDNVFPKFFFFGGLSGCILEVFKFPWEAPLSQSGP